MEPRLIDVPLTVRHTDDPEWDWWVIERAEHSGARWFESTGPNSSRMMLASRISDACIEGPSAEMLAIAEAIERNISVAFRRCSAIRTEEGYEMGSPRNSTYQALVPFERAKALAADIRAKVTSAKIEGA